MSQSKRRRVPKTRQIRYFQYQRRLGHIPFGYKQADNDPNLLIPIPEQLQARAKAFDYIRQGASYRETAAWLSATTGRYISAPGLKKMVDRERQKESLAERLRKLQIVNALDGSPAA